MDLNLMKDVVSKSSLFGVKDSNGQDFDDLNVCSEKGLPFPTLIIVRKGDIVDGISFGYGQTVLEHGGQGGTRRVFSLQEGEYITKVAGNYLNYCNQQVIQNLAFYTSNNRCFEVNKPQRNNNYFEYSAKSGKAICCSFGRSGRFLGCIGFYERDINIKTGQLFSGMKSFGL